MLEEGLPDCGGESDFFLNVIGVAKNGSERES